MSDKSLFFKMVIALALVTGISTSLLVGVYHLTSEPIDRVNKQKIIDALEQVLPKFDSDPSAKILKVPIDGDTLTLYPVHLNDEFVGVAVKTFSKNAFGGLMEIMVGFLPDGTIYNTSVISHKETPGLGDKIDKKKGSFSVAFNGINPSADGVSGADNTDVSDGPVPRLRLKADGGAINGITASTISSRAFCEAVERAYRCFVLQLQKK